MAVLYLRRGGIVGEKLCQTEENVITIHSNVFHLRGQWALAPLSKVVVVLFLISSPLLTPHKKNHFGSILEQFLQAMITIVVESCKYNCRPEIIIAPLKSYYSSNCIHVPSVNFQHTFCYFI